MGVVRRVGELLAKLRVKRKRAGGRSGFNPVARALIARGLARRVAGRLVCCVCGEVLPSGDSLVRHFECFHEDVLASVFRRR